MSLKQSLNSVEALYRKLERESYRAYHERDKIHKADHFYNFCITAQAMRDYFFERKGLIQNNVQQPYHRIWIQNEFLVAVSDIANTAKHFTLRDRKTKKEKKVKTKKVRVKKSKFVDVYVNKNSEISLLEVEVPDCIVTIENGTSYDMYSFTNEVLSYWYSFLRNNGVQIRKQPLRRLIGERT